LSINVDAVQPRPYRTTHDVIFFNCQADCTFHATTGPK